MNRVRQMGAALVLSSCMTGCAGYHGLVNSLAPDKQLSAVTAGRGDVPAYARGETFCVVPPPPVREVYMVMPEAGGKVGTVAMTFDDGRETVLHGHYHALTLAGDEAQPFVGDRAQMEQLFGAAVAALPQAPYSARLYFLLGKDELTPESSRDAEQVLANIAGRTAPEVRVVGHTDSVGSAADNERLSTRRAEKVRLRLIALGVPAASIDALGVGERELLVPTPDNTKEPRNRCVEISVR